MTDPRAMPATISRVTSTGDFPRHHSGRNHNVIIGDHLPQQLTLAPVEILILRLRVSSCVLRVLRSMGSSDESAAQALNLLLAAGRRSYAETTAPSLRAVAIA